LFFTNNYDNNAIHGKYIIFSDIKLYVSSFKFQGKLAKRYIVYFHTNIENTLKTQYVNYGEREREERERERER